MATKSLDSNQETRQRIINAATACIRRYGLAKTAMEDVAKTAGLSRKTLYRFFASRNALLSAVVVGRADEFVGRLRSIVNSNACFDEAIVQATLEGLKWMRKDHVFISAIEGASERGVERYLIDPKSVLHKATLNFWKDAFRIARERGELREELTDQEVVTCLRAANLMLWLREDMKTEQQEEYLRKFLLPVLTPPAAGEKAQRATTRVKKPSS